MWFSLCCCQLPASGRQMELLKPSLKPWRFFVGRQDPVTAKSDLKNYITDIGMKDVECNKLQAKDGRVFKTAAFGVSCKSNFVPCSTMNPPGQMVPFWETGHFVGYCCHWVQDGFVHSAQTEFWPRTTPTLCNEPGIAVIAVQEWWLTRNSLQLQIIKKTDIL